METCDRSTENSAQCYVDLDEWEGGGAVKEIQWGGNMCIHIANLLHCTAKKRTQYCKAITFQFKKSVKERSEMKTVISFYSVSIFSGKNRNIHEYTNYEI